MSMVRYFITHNSKCQFLVFLVPFFFLGCHSNESESKSKHLLKEVIVRHSEEHYFILDKPLHKKRVDYPWDESFTGSYPRITLDFFRCKGTVLNPVITVAKELKEPARYYDCGGVSKHGLPLKEGNEFIYPILLKLLNYIQLVTGKRVVITSGYRCPKHNLYVDSAVYNQISKHMIGAEVDFYVQGLEEDPKFIVELIFRYYQEFYLNNKVYQEFKRYTKSDTNVVPT